MTLRKTILSLTLASAALSPLAARTQSADGRRMKQTGMRVFCVNTAGEPKDVAIDGTMTGVLSGKRWTGKLHLESLGMDLTGEVRCLHSC